MLTVSFLLCLLESARVKSIHHVANLQTELAMMNVFAEYNNELWENYRSLGRSISDLEEDVIKQASVGNNEEQFSFLNFSVSEVSDLNYALVTDENGKVWINSISNYMQEYFLYENVQSLYSAYESIKGLLASGEFDVTKLDTALKTLEDAQTNNTETKPETKPPSTTTQGSSTKKNPIEEIKKLQKKGILELVLKEPDSVSNKSINLKNAVSERSLKKGTLTLDTSVDWVDTTLFQQYLFQYFGTYLRSNENTSLAYELEYLIGNKGTDIANLKAVANKILLTRQAVNMIYLLSDAEKVSMANTMALGLVAVGVPPGVTEIVKIGIITAWAYAESILDVRALFAGKKIPLMKSKQLWTLDINKIASIGDGFLMAKESKTGISYENYLRILLFFEDTEQLAFHTMDIVECNIRQKDADFSMDEMVIGASVGIKYVYSYLFSSFQFLPISQNGTPSIIKNVQFFY